jgi:hypothetical protein
LIITADFPEIQPADKPAGHLSLMEIKDQTVAVLIQAVESSGFSISGPTDSRAAEHGEPAWVCNARAAIAGATACVSMQ